MTLSHVNIKTSLTKFRKSLYSSMYIACMQIQDNKKLYIPAVAFLMAIMVFALSPVSPVLAQESSDAQEEDSSERSHDEKSYEGKDGKSCADKKNKDKSESTTRTSGNQA